MRKQLELGRLDIALHHGHPDRGGAAVGCGSDDAADGRRSASGARGQPSRRYARCRVSATAVRRRRPEPEATNRSESASDLLADKSAEGEQPCRLPCSRRRRDSSDIHLRTAGRRLACADAARAIGESTDRKAASLVALRSPPARRGPTAAQLTSWSASPAAATTSTRGSWAAHRPLHPGQSHDRGAEHAGRGLHEGHPVCLWRRREGRPDARDRQPRHGHRAAAQRRSPASIRPN